MRGRTNARLALLGAALSVMLLGGSVLGPAGLVGGLVFIGLMVAFSSMNRPDDRTLALTPPSVQRPVTEHWPGMTRSDEVFLTANRSGRVAQRTGNIAPLLKDMRGKNLFKASSAARQLGRLGDASAVPYLAQAARQGDLRLQTDAISSLAMIGTDGSFDALLRLMQDDPRTFGDDILRAVRTSRHPRVPQLLEVAERQGGWYLRYLVDDIKKQGHPPMADGGLEAER